VGAQYTYVHTYSRVCVGAHSHPPSTISQNSPIRATALPKSAYAIVCKMYSMSVFPSLRIYSPSLSLRRSAPPCLTKALLRLWDWNCSDGGVCKCMQGTCRRASERASQCSTPGSSVPRTSTIAYIHTKQSLEIDVSQVVLCRVLAAKF
jgi:hypothetical protein